MNRAMEVRGLHALAPLLVSSIITLVGVGCGDEGITHVDGPFPISIDAGLGTSADSATALDAFAEALPPCPTGYACMNPGAALRAMGLQGTITQPDGTPVSQSCAKGGQEPCDPVDPAKSCPNLTKPFCAHLKLTGALAVELDQCAQTCAP